MAEPRSNPLGHPRSHQTFAFASLRALRALLLGDRAAHTCQFIIGASRRQGCAMSEFGLTFPDALLNAIALRVVELLEERSALAARDPEPWISAEEAAAYIGKPKSRLYDLAAQGAVPVGGDGRSRLFRKSDLDAYLLGHPPATVSGVRTGVPPRLRAIRAFNHQSPLPTRRDATGARQ